MSFRNWWKVLASCLDWSLRVDVYSAFLEKAGQVRPYFKRLRELRDELTGKLGIALPVLSMGMSHDFEVAIEEGATKCAWHGVVWTRGIK